MCKCSAIHPSGIVERALNSHRFFFKTRHGPPALMTPFGEWSGHPRPYYQFSIIRQALSDAPAAPPPPAPAPTASALSPPSAPPDTSSSAGAPPPVTPPPPSLDSATL